MPAQAECAAITLRARNITRVFEAEQWWQAEPLLGVLGEGGKLIGHEFGPDRQRPRFAFLTTGATADCAGAALALKRSLVWLNLSPPALVAFDLVVSRGPAVAKRWAFEGLEKTEVQGNSFSGTIVDRDRQRRLASTMVLPESAQLAAAAGRIEASEKKPGAESLFLNAIRFVEAEGAPLPVAALSSVDLAGVRLGEWVILFYTELPSARSAVFFNVEGSGALKYVVAGLAPGVWELWRDGWVENTGVPVRSHALYFEGPPGGYFLRKFS